METIIYMIFEGLQTPAASKSLLHITTLNSKYYYSLLHRWDQEVKIKETDPNHTANK